MTRPKRFATPHEKPAGTLREGRPEYVLTRDYIWWLGFKRSGLCYFGPQGFVYDKISYPWWARLLGCKPDGPGSDATPAHDLPYAGAPILRVDVKTGEVLGSFMPSREQADFHFREALAVFGVSLRRRRLFYASVDLGAQSAWDRPNDPSLLDVPEHIPLDLME